jgi:hypothetical protein
MGKTDNNLFVHPARYYLLRAVEQGLVLFMLITQPNDVS